MPNTSRRFGSSSPALLTSCTLGSHNGLPVTLVVSTTLQELQSGKGHAVTGGGRARRLVSKAQRIVLYNKDRGCTFPGCTAPAYHSQVHHAVADWGRGGQTNLPDLTLACGPDNRRVKPGGWSTRKRNDSRTQWLPPPQLDTGQARVNNYHHPQRYLLPDNGEGADGPISSHLPEG